MSTEKRETNLEWTRQQVAEYKRQFRKYEAYAECLRSVS